MRQPQFPKLEDTSRRVETARSKALRSAMMAIRLTRPSAKETVQEMFLDGAAQGETRLLPLTVLKSAQTLSSLALRSVQTETTLRTTDVTIA